MKLRGSIVNDAASFVNKNGHVVSPRAPVFFIIGQK